MKKLLAFFLLAAVISACQKKQYFSSGPDIDLIKKMDAAYYAGDWTTLRSLYADTAKVNVNKWTGGEITADQFVADLKASVADFSEYKQGATPVYETVITDEGTSYTHSWQEWIGKHKNGKEIRIVVHITIQPAGGKVGWAGFIYDTGPLYTMNQPDSVMVMK